jgi:hypothetical protein
MIPQEFPCENQHLNPFRWPISQKGLQWLRVCVSTTSPN